MKRGGHIFLIASAAALVATSCGGSSDSSGASQPVDTVTAEQIQDLAESGMADEIAEASGVPEACVELSLAMAAATGGMVPGAGDGLVDIDALNRSFDAIKGMAPDDLLDDIDIVKNGMAEYLSVFAEYGNDIEAMMTDPEALQRFSSVFDDEKFSEASENFSTWLETVCKQ